MGPADGLAAIQLPDGHSSCPALNILGGGSCCCCCWISFFPSFFFVEDLFWFKVSMGSVNGSVILGLFQCRISLWGSLWEGGLLAWHGQEAKARKERKNSRKRYTCIL